MNSIRTYRIAYCHPPSLGGPYTRFLNLSKGLFPHGWKLFFVGLGVGTRKNISDILNERYIFIGDGNRSQIKQHVMRLVDWVQQENISILMTYGDIVSVQAIPYLPSDVRCVYHCGVPSYTALFRAKMLEDRIHRIVTNSVTIEQNLINKFNIAPKVIELICSGVDLSMYPGTEKIMTKPINRPIKLLYVGRICDLHKGIGLLPSILGELRNRDVQFKLDIVGDGLKRKWLFDSFKKMGFNDDIIKFKGERLPNEIPALIFGADIFIMPSRFEGCPHVLLEAMACGIVPVVSYIRGSTDVIIDHKTNGFICPMNKPSAFADAIYFLARNPNQLRAMSLAARKRIEKDFSLDHIAEAYHNLFNAIMDERPRKLPSLALSQFKPNSKLYRTWRSKVPASIKKIVYALREKVKR